MLRSLPGGQPGGEAGPERMLREGQRSGRLIHLEQIPGRPGAPVSWPDWAPQSVIEAFGRRGVQAPWSHQVAAAGHARAGRHVII
jgi:DEAD/DEAH box helicase domain-containing protein